MPQGGAFGEALGTHWKRVYNFAYRMTHSREDAGVVTEETFRRAWAGREKLPAGADTEPWLLRIASHVLERRFSADALFSWDLLDDTLRSEATRTDIVHALTAPERNYMLWELKQGCMTAVAGCLSQGERVAFVLSMVMGLSDEEASRVLDIKPNAYKVRLSRARQKVSDYLASRCEHVDARNPCHCPSRLGVALAKGFIAPPPSAAVRLRTVQPFESGTGRNVERIYATLPDPDPPGDLYARLNQAVETGAWG